MRTAFEVGWLALTDLGSERWHQAIDSEHELALVLNTLVDLSAFLMEDGHACCDSGGIPTPMYEKVIDTLVEYSGLCPIKHLNDYGQCIVSGCPVFERETRS